MTQKSDLKGIICAVVTPLRDSKPDLDNLQRLIGALKAEGCDGILLLGTTGEGPSFNVAEREAIISAAKAVSGDMLVMAGTGFASITDAVDATRSAFDLGVDTVVIVPPYYYKKVSTQGLFAFYREILDQAVPRDGLLMLYHIPQVSAVPINEDLLAALVDYAGDRIAGVKDSGGDLSYSQSLIRRFPDQRIFVGTDKILLGGLKAGAAGCITAAANVISPLAVRTYQAFQRGEDATAQQELLTAARSMLDEYQPASGMLKSLLALRFGNDGWDTRPPLETLPDADRDSLVARLNALALPENMGWLKQRVP